MDEPLNRGRRETDAERLDRNWDELLQELRVAQTGVQLLAGFLLTLPFQERFPELDDLARLAYLVAFSSAIVATSLLIAPVSAHRLVFRERRKPELVRFANRCAKAGLAALGVTVVAVAFFIFDFVVGRTEGVVASTVALLLFLSLWVMAPTLGIGRRDDD
jgi:putative flippase GtrA